MTVNRTFDFTAGQHEVGEAPALLQPKRRWSLNPFSYVWTAMQWIAFWFAPANGCAYCLAWRMFFIGMLAGGYLVHAFPWIRLW